MKKTKVALNFTRVITVQFILRTQNFTPTNVNFGIFEIINNYAITTNLIADKIYVERSLSHISTMFKKVKSLKF